MGKFFDKIRQVFNLFLIMLLIAAVAAVFIYFLTTPEQRGTTFAYRHARQLRPCRTRALRPDVLSNSLFRICDYNRSSQRVSKFQHGYLFINSRCGPVRVHAAVNFNEHGDAEAG